jgi:TetR/AcrR family transcriptional regulator, mexJK operon transcriptional repressor
MTTEASGKRTKLAERRRRRLLNAARDLFLSKSFDGTSIDEIVSVAECSKTTFYNEFGGKEGLFEAVVVDMTRQLIKPIESLPDQGTEPRAVLLAMGQSFAEMVLANKTIDLVRLVIAEAPRFPAVAKQFYASGPREARARVAAKFREFRNSGTLKVNDPDLAAELFLNMIGNLQLSKILGIQRLDRHQIDALIVSAVDAILSSATCKVH